MQNNVHGKLFILALFITVKDWKSSKYPSVGGQIMVQEYNAVMHTLKKNKETCRYSILLPT